MDIGSGFGGDDRQRYLRIALVAGVALVVLLLILIVAAIVRNRASGEDPTATVARTSTRPAIVASPAATPRSTVAVSVPPSTGPSTAPSAAPQTSARPSAAAGRTFVVANTGGDGLTLRSEPSTNAQIITVLPDGQRLTEVGPGRNSEGRDWLNVRDEKGNTGWVAAEFASPAP